MTVIRRLFSPSALKVTSWLLATIVVTVGINLIGIRIVGDIGGWQRWLAAHQAVFFVWRLSLYAGLAWGWWWMHRRIVAREPDKAARWRLVRGELAAALLIVVFEVTVALR